MTRRPPIKRGIDWTILEEKRESPLERFWSARGLSLSRVINLMMGVVAVSIPMFVIYRGFFGNLDMRIERALIVCLFSVYALLRYPVGRRKWTDSPNWFFAIDAFLILLAIAAAGYAIWGNEAWHADTSWLPVTLFSQEIKVDHLVGAIVIAITVDATRRSFGWIMPGLAGIFISYSLFANHFPGELRGAAISLPYLLELLYVLPEGVYGVGADILLAMLFLFMLFGSLLVSSRVSAAFVGLANALVGRFMGGPAKVAVVGSALMGTTSGSAIANVATIGYITIPMMKKAGYPAMFAAAVEACSSSGGQFMPPVMGAAAFLISIFTNTSYWNICLYAAVPAILYYMAIFIQVHLKAKKERLMGLPASEVPSLVSVVVEGGHLFVPFIVLVALLSKGYNLGLSCVTAMIVTFLMSFVKKETRFTPRSFLLAIEGATDKSIPIAMVLIMVGIIVGSIITTGLGVRLTSVVTTLSMGNMALGLILTAIVNLILGTALGPTLIYLLCLIFAIPAVIKLGVPVIPAHLFCFLYAAASEITPPVCVTAFVAADIAGSPRMRTGWEAMKIGFASFVVPFAFVLRPAMLIMGGTNLVEGVLALLSAALGIAGIAAGFEGWLLRRCHIVERLLLGGAGICLLAPSWVAGAAGAVIIIAVLAEQKLYRQKQEVSTEVKRS